MTISATAYPMVGRIASLLLFTVSRGSPLILLVLLLLLDTRLSNPLRLIRAFALWCLVPGIVGWILERSFAARVSIESGSLVLDRRTQRIEIPCESIDAVIPWRIPFPAAGLWLRLRSGTRFRLAVRLDDPAALVEALVVAGAPERLRVACAEPSLVYSGDKHPRVRRWYRPILKFGVFALVPTLPLFRLHQWIAYGGTFGEYYLFGLKAYLLAFGIYWATFAIYLVMYAALLRGVAETVALATAYLVPVHAARARRVAEFTCRVCYFGGVPCFLLRLLLSSRG